MRNEVNGGEKVNGKLSSIKEAEASLQEQHI